MTPISKQAGAPFQEFLETSLNRIHFEALPLAGDASSRRYYRVVSKDESWVLMSWDPFKDDGKFPFLNVRDHFARHAVQVPEVIGKDPAAGLILLEDLGDLTLERKFWENQNQELALPYYRQAIDELIKIHFQATRDRSFDCVAFSVQFDVEKLLWEMNYGKDHLLLKFCGLNLSATELKALDSVFVSICSTLHNEEKFIAHRDYHSRNLMLKLGRMRVIDFQDARMGAVQYDLVSLLRDSYVNLNDQVAHQLLDYYVGRRKEVLGGAATPVSREHFERIFELQTVQRCFKACGSFASFFNLRKDTRYLKYLHHTLHTVRRALGRFPEHQVFAEILQAHGVFERKFEDL